ncbi:hypothetical protein RO3G_03496 [Rhizopus delemar RA 99-880]|uniref:Phosphotransferase n=1 Tax=Rhizopus delemar (strain RA 99-880 / ATCC MYA-4621 / FGSC 9543 / NRRL 43880) TaxID=246409 RepID=I1BRG1_RHIO9|nr:hypothetical protein RO3G_03496 [Rhizopus delemar RA 99-880]|eukprot:EIE78791.1 hypothetical protein RO3G_03496 [Rhizopus delemar RA 99-880]
MAVSFGFAIKQTRLNTGRILSLGYGLNYPNGVGVDIVELMHERMRLKGLPIKIVAIANDSACTLLAHAYQHPTTRIGIVHSLGTNCAYYEPVKNVTKLKDQSVTKNTDIIMNTEWCNFGSSKRTLPCTWFDRKLSRESINPQFHVFEKMTTGIFLGFVSSYMYVCEADDSDNLEDTRIILEDMLDLSKTAMGDREVVKKICELVGMRAAKLVGASIAAIVQHML